MDIAERFATLEGRMNVVETGVSNFRSFQEESREFYVEYRLDKQKRVDAEAAALKEAQDAAELAEKKRWKRPEKIAAVALLITVLTTFSAWFVPKAWDFVVTDLKIHQEWHEVHKTDVRVTTENGRYITAERR
jgi:hypothetical protein